MIEKKESPLKRIALELLRKYEVEREVAILELSQNVAEDEKKLQEEVKQYRHEIARYI